MAKAIEMSEKNKNGDDHVLPNEKVDLWVIAVERTREYDQGLATEKKKSILWAAVDFTRINDGHSKANRSDHLRILLQSLPVLPVPRLHVVCM